MWGVHPNIAGASICLRRGLSRCESLCPRPGRSPLHSAVWRTASIIPQTLPEALLCTGGRGTTAGEEPAWAPDGGRILGRGPRFAKPWMDSVQLGSLEGRRRAMAT